MMSSQFSTQAIPQSRLASPAQTLQQPGQPGIRQRLEQDAWQRYPDFARRLQQRRLARLRQQARQRERLRQDGIYFQPQVFRWKYRSLLAVCMVLATFLLADTSAAQTQAQVQPGEDWGLIFQGDGQRQQAVALDTLIDADINGLVARVNVRQRFRNTGRQWSEATYRFPLPAGAAVDRLQIQVGERLIEGEIKEKQEARRQYQQAKENGLIAALLDQQRDNQFETKLANIGPGEEITVNISFLQRVDFRAGEYSLQIPLTFTPRWDPARAIPVPATSLADDNSAAIVPDPADEQVFIGQPLLNDHRLELRLKLRSAMQLNHINSRYHDMDIHPGLGGYDLALVNPDTLTDRIFELNWTPQLGSSPQAALSTWDGGDAVYALLMLVPPLAGATQPQEREVLFIIDTSGSMQGLALEQAKAALYQGLAQLKQDDRFNLVEFNSDSYTLFHSSVAADGNYLEEALNFIEDLDADGGTNMAPALHDAMTLPAPATLPGQPALLRQIVFITDGSVGNEQELVRQISEELGESRLFTVSIGSAPNIGFMRKAAEIGRGSHTHIGQLEDVEQVMNQLWQRIEHPALQDIEVDWGMQADYYPEIIPDLYAGEPLWLVARLPAQPGQIVLSGHLNGQDWQQESAPYPGAGNESLATLWARGLVEAIQDSQLFLDTDPALLRQSVIDVALEFGLLTPYTSLVAVDRSPVRPEAESLSREQIGNLLPFGSTLQWQGFSSTAAGWQWQLLGAVLLLSLSCSMLWLSVPAPKRQASGSPHAGLNAEPRASVQPRPSLPQLPVPAAAQSSARQPSLAGNPGLDQAA